MPPFPRGDSSNTGAIVGGVGGAIAILVAIVVIFYLRRRSHRADSRGGTERAAYSPDSIPEKPPTQSAVSAGVSASTGQPERPLSDGGTLASSSLPVSPDEIKLYVRVSVTCIAFCVSLSSYFCTPRTRTTRVCSRSLLISEVEAFWPISSPRSPKTGNITVSPLSDLIYLESSHESGTDTGAASKDWTTHYIDALYSRPQSTQRLVQRMQ